LTLRGWGGAVDSMPLRGLGATRCERWARAAGAW